MHQLDKVLQSSLFAERLVGFWRIARRAQEGVVAVLTSAATVVLSSLGSALLSPTIARVHCQLWCQQAQWEHVGSESLRSGASRREQGGRGAGGQFLATP